MRGKKLPAFDFLGDGHETTDGEGTVGMGLAVGLDTLTEGDVVGGDEEGGHQVALQIGDWVCHTIEQGLYLLGALGYQLLVVHQVGTDEHQGRELAAGGLAVELDVGIVIEETEVTEVGLVECDGAVLTMTATQQLDQLGLEIGDDGIGEQTAGIDTEQLHMADADAWHGYLELVVEHVERDSKTESSLTLADLGDNAIASCHRAVSDQHTVALADFSGGGKPLAYLEVHLADGITEEVHLLVRDANASTLPVTVCPHGRLQRIVPGTAEDGIDERIVAIDEHEAVEVVAEGLSVKFGLVLSITVTRDVRTGQRRPVLYLAERDEILEGRQRTLLLVSR